MSIPHLDNLDLNKNQLLNAVMQLLAAAPNSPVEGLFYYNSAEHKAYQYKGASLGWRPIGDENVIEAIKVNGTAQSIVDKTVDISVPVASDATPAMDGAGAAGSGTAFARADHVHPHDTDKLDKAGGTMSGPIAMGSNKITGLGDGTNDQDAVTVKQLNAAKVGALKPSGSVAFASLPSLTAANLNKMYNVTDAFTTTSDFVEGAGKSYPAGTNVAIINTGSDASPVYKYDAMTGMVDLSGLVKIASGTIPTSGTSATVSFTGTVVSTYALQNGDEVLLNVAIGVSSVTFSVASAPSSAVTCVVAYI